MNANHFEILSAFFDGEAVDADLLAATLREPGATDALVEFARLRRAVHADSSRPREPFCESLRETVSRVDRRSRLRRRLVGLSLAASLALAAALGGFGVRSLLMRQPSAPPARHDATAAAPVPASPAARSQVVPMPAPTPVRATPVAPRAHGLPSPALRMRFAEWRDSAL